jgi:hypothetical protein
MCHTDTMPAESDGIPRKKRLNEIAARLDDCIGIGHYLVLDRPDRNLNQFHVLKLFEPA